MSPVPPSLRPEPHRRFFAPLDCEQLLDIGAEFPILELKPRILTQFWRDCCTPAWFSRAPAPVVEFASEARATGEPRVRIAAWWLLADGIMEDLEGPNSERLRPYFGGIGRTGQLWPRYEFSIQPPAPALSGNVTATVELSTFPEPLVHRRYRVRFATAPALHVRVVEREALSAR